MPNAKPHPADAANLADVRAAVSFNVHLRRSPTSKLNVPAATLAEAIASAADIAAAHGGRKPLIYAITADGRTALVTPEIVAAMRQPSEAADPAPAGSGEPSVVPDPAPAQPEEPPAPPAAKTSRPKAGKRAAIEEAARRGVLPAPPDFSAPTHARYRAKLKHLVAMAKAGNLEGLRAEIINPVSSSPKAMARYRDLAVIALEARAARKAA